MKENFVRDMAGVRRSYSTMYRRLVTVPTGDTVSPTKACGDAKRTKFDAVAVEADASAVGVDASTPPTDDGGFWGVIHRQGPSAWDT